MKPCGYTSSFSRARFTNVAKRQIQAYNDQVRVLEYRLKPGEKEVMHSHSAGVVYGFNEAKTKATLPDGKVTDSTGKAGDVFWRNPITHALENIGNTDVHALAVELKKPCKQ
jgi:hypothetical protein